MKTIVLRGPVLTSSGYGNHCRQIARWLLDRNDVNVKFNPTPWGDTPWIIDTGVQGGLIGQIMQRSITEVTAADVSLQLQLPNEWDPKLAPVNVGITAVVETDRCAPSWVTACNTMSAVIVPSQHAKNCLTNTGDVLVPLYVVPEAYFDAIAAEDVPHASIGNFSAPFNFLVFGQITGNNPHNDRKNTFFTIKWLCEAFRDDPDVGIVIKTNAGRNTKIDRNVVTTMLKQLLNEVRRGPYPRVTLLHGDMNDREVAALYRHDEIKALVALTRGEGFGLPLLEAAASGLPIIATGWSGHMDFMKLGRFVQVPYKLEELHPTRVDGRIFVKGARWAFPSEEDFKKRVLKFRNAPSIPKQWALELRDKILQRYSYDSIRRSYDAALNGIV